MTIDEFDKHFYDLSLDWSILSEEIKMLESYKVTLYRYQVFSSLVADKDALPLQAEYIALFRNNSLRFFRYILIDLDWEDEGPLFTGFATNLNAWAVMEEGMMYLDEYTREFLNREYEESLENPRENESY